MERVAGIESGGNFTCSLCPCDYMSVCRAVGCVCVSIRQPFSALMVWLLTLELNPYSLFNYWSTTIGLYISGKELHLITLIIESVWFSSLNSRFYKAKIFVTYLVTPLCWKKCSDISDAPWISWNAARHFINVKKLWNILALLGRWKDFMMDGGVLSCVSCEIWSSMAE